MLFKNLSGDNGIQITILKCKLSEGNKNALLFWEYLRHQKFAVTGTEGQWSFNIHGILCAKYCSGVSRYRLYKDVPMLILNFIQT